MKALALAVLAAIALSGCVGDPAGYESDPVTVSTSGGNVVCQLYTKRVVRWDRAIDRPNGMSVQDADAICLQEGERWKNS